MNRYSTERDAKEFLVAAILREADQEGRPLDEIERKMLYFSETSWTLPGLAEVAGVFDSQYNDRKYERRIASLIRAARKRDGKAGAEAWTDAIKRLAEGDHYLLVMIDQAGGRRFSSSDWRAGGALLGMFGALIAVSAWYLDRLPTRSELTGLMLAGAVALYGAVVLSRVVFGRPAVDRVIFRVIDWVLGSRRA